MLTDLHLFSCSREPYLGFMQASYMYTAFILLLHYKKPVFTMIFRNHIHLFLLYCLIFVNEQLKIKC